MEDNDKIYLQIGKNIKKYRELKGLTQQALADKIGIGLNFMGKIEVAFSRPSIPTLLKIANALDIKIYQLFKFDN